MVQGKARPKDLPFPAALRVFLRGRGRAHPNLSCSLAVLFKESNAGTAHLNSPELLASSETLLLELTSIWRDLKNEDWIRVPGGCGAPCYLTHRSKISE